MKESMIELIEAIEEQYELECTFAEDGRYNWPARWEALRKALSGVKIPKRQLPEMIPGERFDANGYQFRFIVADNTHVYAEHINEDNDE